MIRQSVSEFTGTSWMVATVNEATRSRAHEDARAHEALVITRQHHFGLAMHWKVLGELDNARRWAKKLTGKFSPKSTPVTPPVFNFNLSIAFVLATAFDPTQKQFADLFVACGLIDETEELLGKMEREASSGFHWMDCAAIWFQLDNLSRARDCLRKCESGLSDDLNELSWMSLAEMWGESGDMTEARRCLNEARKTIATAMDWCSIAGRWEELGDRDASRECIEKAVECPETWEDWSSILDYWMARDDRDSVRRHIEPASEAGRELNDHLNIARIWDWLDDSERASRHLSLANSMAHNSQEWADIAWHWHEANDKDKALAAMTLAEEKAGGYDDWQACYSQWSTFGDQGAMRRCLEKKARLAEAARGRDDDYFHQILYLAIEWAEFGDMTAARRSLESAGETATTLDEWHLVGVDRAKLGDAKAMERAFSRAESLAKGSGDWLMCAIRRADWGQLQPMRACMAQARASISSDEDRLQVADATGALLGKKAEADFRKEDWSHLPSRPTEMQGAEKWAFNGDD